MIETLRAFSSWKWGIPLMFVLSVSHQLSIGIGQAQTPRTPQEMLDNAAENLHVRLRELKASPLTGEQALEALREFIEERRLAQRVIALDFPLDDFSGLVMMDRYDEAYIEVIDSLITHYTAGDPVLPTPDAVDVFTARLGTLPPFGDTPAAFIIAILISRAWNAAYSMPADDAMRADVAKVALRGIGQATANYRQTRSGERREKTDDFWHTSVIQRMLCPDHRCPYTVLETRNGLQADGALFRRYVVQCAKGSENRNVDFDLGVLSEMTRSGGVQDLKTPVRSPATRRPTVDP